MLVSLEDDMIESIYKKYGAVKKLNLSKNGNKMIVNQLISTVKFCIPQDLGVLER